MRKGTGFTLIELIVVIAIIAILAAIVAPNAFKAIEKARISGLEGDYRNMKTGTMSYYSDVGGWPADNSCNNTAPANCPLVITDGNVGWSGPYMEKWPTRDAWGGSYTYRKDTNQVFTTAAVSERYVAATLVANSSAGKLDMNIDDNANGTGMIRYAAGSTVTLNMEISDDTY
jgi:general secretion pathway protein G